MPAPVYAAGTVGNVINGASVAKQTTIAAFLDLSTAIEGQVNCEVTTGTGAPTAGTTFSAYRAYAAGASAPITLTAGAAAGATSITVGSASGLHQGQNIALQQATGLKLGEVASITGAITGTGPYVVPVSPTINSYSIGDGVYLMSQTAIVSITPSSPTGAFAASKDYSAPMYLGTGQYILAANNADTTQTVTVTATCDKVTSFQ